MIARGVLRAIDAARRGDCGAWCRPCGAREERGGGCGCARLPRVPLVAPDGATALHPRLHTGVPSGRSGRGEFKAAPRLVSEQDNLRWHGRKEMVVTPTPSNDGSWRGTRSGRRRTRFACRAVRWADRWCRGRDGGCPASCVRSADRWGTASRSHGLMEMTRSHCESRSRGCRRKTDGRSAMDGPRLSGSRQSGWCPAFSSVDPSRVSRKALRCPWWMQASGDGGRGGMSLGVLSLRVRSRAMRASISKDGRTTANCSSRVTRRTLCLDARGVGAARRTPLTRMCAPDSRSRSGELCITQQIDSVCCSARGRSRCCGSIACRPARLCHMRRRRCGEFDTVAPPGLGTKEEESVGALGFHGFRLSPPTGRLRSTRGYTRASLLGTLRQRCIQGGTGIGRVASGRAGQSAVARCKEEVGAAGRVSQTHWLARTGA